MPVLDPISICWTGWNWLVNWLKPVIQFIEIKYVIIFQMSFIPNKFITVNPFKYGVNMRKEPVQTRPINQKYQSWEKAWNLHLKRKQTSFIFVNWNTLKVY